MNPYLGMLKKYIMQRVVTQNTSNMAYLLCSKQFLKPHVNNQGGIKVQNLEGKNF